MQPTNVALAKMMNDFVYAFMADQWIHPETCVTINAEDMPWELVSVDE